MIILALDISASPGVALLEIKGGQSKLIAVDSLETDSGYTDAQRFEVVEAFVINFLHGKKVPNVVVREKFIKGGSKRATQLVFGAWSSVDRALLTYGYFADDKNEIVAAQVKKIVGGKGGASKEEVAEGVIRIMGEEVRPYLFTDKGRLLDDRSDAIAIGLTWASKNGLIEI